MEKKAIIFILLISVFASFFALKANATFDCLNNLSPSSSQPDKDYCQNELTQIEAEYASLTQQKADWKILVGLLREMGITNLSLFGELGYMLNRGHIGCVYDAEEQLGEHFKVEVNKQLVFPEIDLTRAMINFLNRNRCWG